MLIFTKKLNATVTRGERVKAYTASHPSKAQSITIPYDYSMDYPQVHAKAAQALAESLGISANFKGCDSPDGMVFMSCDGPNAFDTLHIGMSEQ